MRIRGGASLDPGEVVDSRGGSGLSPGLLLGGGGGGSSGGGSGATSDLASRCTTGSTCDTFAAAPL